METSSTALPISFEVLHILEALSQNEFIDWELSLRLKLRGY